MVFERIKTMDVYVYGDKWANAYDYSSFGSTAGDHGYGVIANRARSYQSELQVASAIVSDSTPEDEPLLSAALEVKSTAKGFLPPRMTTAQKAAVPSPVDGLMLYDSDLERLSVYSGARYQRLGNPKVDILTTSAGAITITGGSRSQYSSYWEADGNVNLLFSGATDGDSGSLLIRADLSSRVVTLPSLGHYAPTGGTITIPGGTNNWSLLIWESKAVGGSNVVFVTPTDYSR
jgi:hypothetical protein